ncbi:small GTPase superfamily [Mycena capillaripes]|nr:small GTPase superfamily [Mycena capillaripes]
MDKWIIAVLGDGGVGKTALATQFTLNCFVYDPTLEDCYRKQLVLDNRMCMVEVIDTAGQEEYAALRDQWVREGHGFILVYSIAARESFDRLEALHKSVIRVKVADPILTLVGNKSDIAEREVSKEEGAALARKLGCEFMETSAKTAQNVERAFTSVIRALRQTKNIEPLATPNGTPGKKKIHCIIL